MKIELIKYPTIDDWDFCKTVALNTVSKNMVNSPDLDWKIKMLNSEHSPIRTLWFAVKMEIPYYVSVHLVRHKIGVEHFVSSQRNDRQNNYDRTKAPQDAIVTHIMYMNAQALMEIMRKRLCGQADSTTREVMFAVRNEIVKTCPEMKSYLVPNCVYLNGDCHEFNCCGMNEVIYEQ